MAPLQIVRTAQKEGLIGKAHSSIRLAPQFQRRQSCFGLDTLVAVKIKVRSADGVHAFFCSSFSTKEPGLFQWKMSENAHRQRAGTGV